LIDKYSVAFPSSAAVEGQFSNSGMIGMAKPNRLEPVLFEGLLLLWMTQWTAFHTTEWMGKCIIWEVAMSTYLEINGEIHGIK
jgi:hypothetical protein